jgi:group II intron reverse transcriptase/maturase
MAAKPDNPTAPVPAAAKPGAPLLDQILARANLAAAWEAVAGNEGVPGADKVRVERFARTWEERATALADAVRGNRYQPGRLRVTTIPKPDGGTRRISIPTVADRLLQRAALQVLMERFEHKFLSCSYGYRPRRGVAQAVAAVIRYRDRGRRWVVEADIDDCFGSLDHTLLLDLLAQEVADWRVMQLMRWWLDAGRPQAGAARGIALGMPISPLWANVYLHELDWQLVRNRWPLVRYADDFVVLVESEAMGERALGVIERKLADLKLRLEPTKTRISSFTDGFDFLGVHFQGDEYSFNWARKRITIEGDFDWLWSEKLVYEY